MANRLSRRLEALEGDRSHYTIGELLDALDGVPLPSGRSVHPALCKAFKEMPCA